MSSGDCGVKEEPVVGGNRPATSTLEPCRILVVDDNRDAATSFAMLLNIVGNITELAFDGVEALEKVALFKPDFVFLDIGLPQLNGYEVARRIRQELDEPRITLIAVTGWGQDEDRRRSKAAGFDHHLTKPVDFSTVQALLAKWNCPNADPAPAGV